MKKIYVLIILAASSLTAFCQQPNKKLIQLADYLEQQGAVMSHTQYREIPHCTNEWIDFVEQRWYSNLPSGTIDMETVLDSIRQTFSSISKEATKSYHYEYHADGVDTVKYSFIFFKNDGKHDTINQDNCFSQRDRNYEYAFFNMYKDRCNFEYVVAKSSGVNDWKDLRPFDTEAFNAQIKTVLDTYMTLKGAKAYPVYWRHDYDTDDSKTEGCVSYQYNVFDAHIGLTTGTRYFIPLKYKEEAEALYKQLDSVAYEYLNNHPEQRYTYNFTKQFKRHPNKNYMVPVDMVEGILNDDVDRVNENEEYYLGSLCDDDGYHILSITTKGELWIPDDWPKLKSWVNGKSVYLKGMKPTPNSK